jgi:hypothetical protein
MVRLLWEWGGDDLQVQSFQIEDAQNNEPISIVALEHIRGVSILAGDYHGHRVSVPVVTEGRAVRPGAVRCLRKVPRRDSTPHHGVWRNTSTWPAARAGHCSSELLGPAQRV